ncbi:DUF6414 family protein [Lysinibacillus sp. NPDC098008]|uniref:DUF6414 family protein n=1 Tax=Lysinibacillus sp. NPDC098008 TaxID=3364146 RepID=UPI0037FC9F87
MKKIIYFDEGSATDILLMEHGGQITEINESTGTIKLKGQVDGSAEGKAGTGFLNIVKATFNVKSTGTVSLGKDKIATKTITNTILTDFLALKDRLVSENKVVVLDGYKVYALINSFAYLKMYAPYMKVFKEDSTAFEGSQDFNLQNVDEILSTAKSYYELVGIKNDEKIILRFNINEFKNAYVLTDLPKMNLKYFAVEVGKCTEDELLIEKELAGSNTSQPQNQINVSELIRGNIAGASVENESYLRIYDVILGGIGISDEI